MSGVSFAQRIALGPSRATLICGLLVSTAVAVGIALGLIGPAWTVVMPVLLAAAHVLLAVQSQ
jgi:hypothetical protein